MDMTKNDEFWRWDNSLLLFGPNDVKGVPSGRCYMLLSFIIDYF
jgi:hypothetical protein